MGPFSVSANGTSVQTATGPSALLSMGTPLTKLDITRAESFQTLSILFNHEPPQPTTSAHDKDVQIYQFAHPYPGSIPAVWMNWQNTSPAYPARPTTSGATATTFYDFGDESAAANISGVGNATSLSLFAQAVANPYGTTSGFFYVVVDTKNVTIYFRKTLNQTDQNTNVVPLYVIGVTANMRIYVFAEPATTSTY